MYHALFRCWAIPTVITLLRYNLSYYIAELLQAFLQRWAVPNIDTRLWHTLSCYIAQTFWILKHCWSTPCDVNLLSFSQLQYISEPCHAFSTAELFKFLTQCWVFPRRSTMLTYTLLCYIAELKRVWIHCWGFIWLCNLLSHSQSHCFVEVRPNLLPCRATPSSFYNAELLTAWIHCWGTPTSCYIA